MPTTRPPGTEGGKEGVGWLVTTPLIFNDIHCYILNEYISTKLVLVFINNLQSVLSNWYEQDGIISYNKAVKPMSVNHMPKMGAAAIIFANFCAAKKINNHPL